MMANILPSTRIAAAFFALIAVFLMPRASAEDELPKPIADALTLMNGLGGFKSIEDGKSREERHARAFVVEAEFSTVYFELVDRKEEVRSITRVRTGGPQVSLKWDKQKSEAVARGYVGKLFGEKLEGPPVRTEKENITGDLELWSVGWPRRVEGVIVMDDFVNVSFNETEGLFGFAYSWNTVIPAFDLKSAIPKDEALRKGTVFAEQFLRDSGEPYRAYALERVAQCELMIVSPKKRSSGSVRGGDGSLPTGKLPARLAWVITYSVREDPSKIKGHSVAAAGFSIFVDAATGDLIGTVF